MAADLFDPKPNFQLLLKTIAGLKEIGDDEAALGELEEVWLHGVKRGVLASQRSLTYLEVQVKAVLDEL